jgi:periplasmic protein TonB
MATDLISLIGPTQDGSARKTAGSLRISPTVKNDVFLKALLGTPTTEQARRSPLQWASAMVLHVVIIAALIIVPLYTTGTIHLNEYSEVPLVAPPPLAPPPAPAAGAVAPHITHPKAKLNYTLQKLTAPTAIPKNVSVGSEDAAETAPDLGGVPGGVPGGAVGGVVGGVIGGTGTSAPAPSPVPRATPKILRVGSGIRAPRQTYNIDPVYPLLALETRISGTVLIDAVIDERGNVVQAHVVSGHPLLIAAALRAVQQWKYEPTSLNGQPISVELQLQVHFHPKS